MVAPLFEISPLLSAIDSEALILTPNNRLKNKMLEAYGHHCGLSAQSVWRAPRVYALADWLRETWQSLQDAGSELCRGTLVNNHQRELLWQQVITASPEGAALLNPDLLAKQADLAYRNLTLWQLPLSVLDQYSDADYQLFSRWARAFETELQRRQLLCDEAAYQAIIEALDKGALSKEPTIYLKGFDDLAPLLNTLLQAAADRIEEVQTTRMKSVRIGRIETPDFESEVLAAARWSRQILGNTPSASIGIIVPNLGQCRAQVERLFTSVFEPHYFLPQTPRYTLPFNFSAGVPLAKTALVYDTLQLLQLNRNRMDLAPLCNLLQSPFFADAEREYTGRSELIRRLRELGKMTVSGADLRYHCQQVYSGDSSPPANAATEHDDVSAPNTSCRQTTTPAVAETIPLPERFQQMETLRRQQPKQQLAGQWANFFLHQLTLLGWPGQRRLDSNEYQQVSQWYQLLEVFSSLDVTASVLDLHTALKQLHSLAASTHFQAQVPPSPIQILGALEGAGLQFTHCWVLGLQERDWPPVPAPHPLLPIELQRQHAMPHASSERELVFARSLTAGYRRCAGEVVFSSSQRDGEMRLAPSRLIEDLPLIKRPVADLAFVDPADDHSDDLRDKHPAEGSSTERQSTNRQATDNHSGDNLPADKTSKDHSAAVSSKSKTAPEHGNDLRTYYHRLLQSRNLEWVDCAQGPAIDSEKVYKGGSGILRHQAICPFNAFALYRLGAQAPPAPAPGLSGIERGVVLHEALALIWARLRNSHHLQQTTAEDLCALVEESVRRALAPLQQRRPELLGKHYCALEVERQSQLIGTWLELEKQRPAFQVATIEQREDITIAGVKLQLRLDRLDQLPGGKHLLIDYKTGNPKLQSWQGERPQEPQLPLYAISGNRDIHGIAFAQINAKECRFLGLGEILDDPAGSDGEKTVPANAGLWPYGITAPAASRNLDLPAQWDQVLAHWRRVLDNLAREFQQGESRVDYLEAGLQRYYSDLEPLNRLPEQSQLQRVWAERRWPLAHLAEQGGAHR